MKFCTEHSSDITVCCVKLANDLTLDELAMHKRKYARFYFKMNLGELSYIAINLRNKIKRLLILLGITTWKAFYPVLLIPVLREINIYILLTIACKHLASRVAFSIHIGSWFMSNMGVTSAYGRTSLFVWQYNMGFLFLIILCHTYLLGFAWFKYKHMM